MQERFLLIEVMSCCFVICDTLSQCVIVWACALLVGHNLFSDPFLSGQLMSVKLIFMLGCYA